VTVNDTEKPVIAGCPSNIVKSNDAGLCSATATWTEPTATDNCTAAGSLVWTKSHLPGAVFPVGVTTVTYTVTDAASNTSLACSFTVTVNDTESPIISCPSNITQSALLGQASASVVIPDPVVSDNCSVSTLTWTLSGATSAASPASGTNLIGTYTFNEGITTVAYNSEDAAGHTTSCNFTVTILSAALPLSGNIVSQTDIACFGASTGSVTVSGSDGVPPYEYSINGGPYQTSGTFGTLTAATYSVTIRDANLNTFDVPVTLTQPGTAVSGTINSQTNIICHGGNTGSVTINGSGGVAPYRYKNGTGSYQTSGIFGSLTAGDYTITVEDANLCSFNILVTISEPPAIVLSISAFKDISCFGTTDGSVTISASAGNIPYEYSLNNGTYQASGTFTGIGPGSHIIVVRDVNLCTATIPVTFTEPAELTLSYSATEASCPDESDGSITLVVSGGTQPYNYIWDDGITTGDRANVEGGSYRVVVTDLNGCAKSLDAIVEVTGSPQCIIVQEVITPNNDGFNDTWKIRNIELFPDAEVLVYNRWGQMVYKAKNIPANEWDGTKDGKVLPTDSYHYILHLNDGSKPKTGVVSIIK
jgi:gliding motility-associated-like protein